MDRRSQQILEFPQVRDRLAAHTAFGPSRRLADALTPSDDAVVVARLLDETDQARDLVARRPDLGVGGAHDIAPHVLRARRGGRLSGPDLLTIAQTLAAASRVGEALRGERPALLHELGRSIKPCRSCVRVSSSRSTRPASCSTQHPPRWAACVAPSASRMSACAPSSRRSCTRVTSPQRSRSRSSPCATAATSCPSGPTRAASQGHRPRSVGQRPDAVHRAAGRGRAGQQVARGAAHGRG